MGQEGFEPSYQMGNTSFDTLRQSVPIAGLPPAPECASSLDRRLSSATCPHRLPIRWVEGSRLAAGGLEPPGGRMRTDQTCSPATFSPDHSPAKSLGVCLVLRVSFRSLAINQPIAGHLNGSGSDSSTLCFCTHSSKSPILNMNW